MLEIKVHCDCGARYKFDVEPVGERMPVPVKCPVCGADGTAAANERIRAALRPVAPESAIPSASLPNTAPVTALARPRALTGPPAGRPVPLASTRWPEPAPKLVHGVVGAVAASAIAMLVWWASIQWTGLEIAFVAWGLGLAAGQTARWSSGSGGRVLAGITAGSIFVALAAAYFMAGVDGSGPGVAGLSLPRHTSWGTPLWLALATASAYRVASTPSGGSAGGYGRFNRNSA